MNRLTEAQLIARGAELEPRFEQLRWCTRCERPFAGELVHRRVYEVRNSLALVVLCSPCNDEIPAGSASDAEFSKILDRIWLLQTATHGGNA